jgi:hypothetical protein
MFILVEKNLDIIKRFVLFIFIIIIILFYGQDPFHIHKSDWHDYFNLNNKYKNSEVNKPH